MKILIIFLLLLTSNSFADFDTDFKTLQNAARTDEIILLLGEPDNFYLGYLSYIFILEPNKFLIYDIILDNGYLAAKNKKILQFKTYVGQDLKLKTYKYILKKDD